MAPFGHNIQPQQQIDEFVYIALIWETLGGFLLVTSVCTGGG